MKPLLCLTVLVVFGCKHKPLPPQNTPLVDSIHQVVETKTVLPILKRTPNKYHTNKDTVYIPTEEGAMPFSREEWNCIIDSFPELYSDKVLHPDSTYAKSRVTVSFIDSSGDKNYISFSPEPGTDAYYMLYAWFLKNKNGIQKHAARRKKLLDIYYTINGFFDILYFGGTYYVHQISRIEGYAEYDIYRYIHKKALFVNPPDFRQQKAQFISALKESIGDEVNKDVNLITDIDKRERFLELRKDINYLNREITDYFFLGMARSFRKDNYNYHNISF
jgi:hypothetical protein